MCLMYEGVFVSLYLLGETAEKKESPLSLHYKLFSEQHVPDIVGPSNRSASPPMTRMEMIASLVANCKELDEKKL
ncbi:hypothetical protein A2U01_0035602 [Trifolium medium]|uniref:Uncharacterized protein n=1 Tax=Trifolium medium TaxID=97028 RepID=A0A392PQW4_9FABA|nr:hypothetical protein [Trifolium medium]